MPVWKENGIPYLAVSFEVRQLHRKYVTNCTIYNIRFDELEVIISKNVLKICVDLFSFGLAIRTIRSSKNTNHTQIF